MHPAHRTGADAPPRTRQRVTRLHRLRSTMTQVHPAGEVPVRLPLRRFAQPEEVADLAAFLLRPRGCSITGQRLVICAGASLGPGPLTRHHPGCLGWSLMTSPARLTPAPGSPSTAGASNWPCDRLLPVCSSVPSAPGRLPMTTPSRGLLGLSGSGSHRRRWCGAGRRCAGRRDCRRDRSSDAADQVRPVACRARCSASTGVVSAVLVLQLDGELATAEVDMGPPGRPPLVQPRVDADPGAEP